MLIRNSDTFLPRFSSSLSELLATLSCICGLVLCSFLSCLFSSDKMRFMLNLALELELHRGGKVESPLVARLENHLRQGRLHQRIGWWLARKLVTFWQRCLMYTNHICHLKASRKLRRPESPMERGREQSQLNWARGLGSSLGSSRHFHNEENIGAGFSSTIGKDSSTQSLVGLDDLRRGLGPEVRKIQKSEGLAVQRIIRAGFSSTLGIWKLCWTWLFWIIPLWVKLNVKLEIGKCLPHPSF